MIYSRSGHSVLLRLLLLCLVVFVSACNSTKYIKDGDYLLRSNTVKIKSDKPITQKGEINDNLTALVAQKPNSYTLGIPFKLLLYNSRYKKYQQDSTNFQLKSKTVEKPVIYDSSTLRKSARSMKSYLFNKGYFYATITDTTVFKKKKAYVTYKIETGYNYLINNINYDIQDTTIAEIVRSNINKEVFIKKGDEFTYSAVESERSRMTAVIRDYGYYYFSNDNISFELDTMNKQLFRNIENPFESAINFIALQKNQKKRTLDIKVTINDNDDPKSLNRYGISRVRVFPDFQTNKDYRDSSLISKTAKSARNQKPVQFRYHDYYVRENVIANHLFIAPETYFSQSDNDKTISVLSDLGVFQSVRTSFREDTSRHDGNWLSSNVFMSPNLKYDFVPNLEVSTGNTYAAGTALTLSLRNRNIAKGANLLTTSLTGAVDYYYDTIGNNFFEHFKVLTKSLTAATSLAFPKFLIPFKINGISAGNLPRTVLSLSANLLDRNNYFTLINTNSSISYRWRETKTKSWDITPAFVNTIYLPENRRSATFNNIISRNEYLKNSYRNTFIEGESIIFTFSDKEEQKGGDYSYLKLGFEEAGGLMAGLNGIFKSLSSQYAQYVKFDFDAQHFVLQRHSTIAMRFYGGIGLPYGDSRALPYIKQYFVGGAYSIRGWRVRNLGPGSYISEDQTNNKSGNVIDRTGDIKLEMNAEYRFDIIKLFSGALKLNGAVFADAGNIWLANADKTSYPDGEFAFNKLGKDLAVSTGAGARLDIAGFFLVRLDVGLPVKNPNYTVNGGWIIDKIDFGSYQWRKQNLQLNFGIGYPF